MEKKTVYVPVGPQEVQCVCGADIEIKNFKHPGANEVVTFGGCKVCNVNFAASSKAAGESQFKKVVYLSDISHVHCACGAHVHMDNYKRPGGNEVIQVGYCLPCNIEYRTFEISSV
jgi:hypothetical protein